MAKRTFVANMLLTVAGLVALGIGDAYAAPSGLTLCHVPPGDPANAHTISVAEAAVGPHLAHGDQLGECGAGCVTDADCAEEDACTLGTCEDGECAYLVVDCFDLDPCTDDACDGAGGCTHTPTESPPETSEVTCDDELDNDCDGAPDAADSDCVFCGNDIIEGTEECDTTGEIIKGDPDCEGICPGSVNECGCLPPGHENACRCVSLTDV